jgi:hypothetical protein
MWYPPDEHAGAAGPPTPGTGRVATDAKKPPTRPTP